MLLQTYRYQAAVIARDVDVSYFDFNLSLWIRNKKESTGRFQHFLRNCFIVKMAIF